MKQDCMFDQAALSYDKDFTFSTIGKAQRERVHRFFDRHFSTHDRLNILEINCGTGEDARWLGLKGHYVTATDASSEMITICRSKRKSGRSYFNQCSFQDLHRMFKGRKFDLIFSNFGGLNCISPIHLAELSSDLNELLTDQGKLFLVVMSDQCMMENLYFLAKRKRRWTRDPVHPVDVAVGNQVVRTYYYSPSLLKKSLYSKFRVIDSHPVGLFIPPSYLEHFMRSHPWLFRILNNLEKVFSHKVFSRYGDHYAMIFEKRKA